MDFVDFNKVANAAFIVVAAIYGIYRGIKRVFFPSAESKYGDPHIIKQMARLDERIHELLTQLRIQTQAARVVIARFHNGLYFFDGTPLQKMSFSYESVAGGIDPIKDTYKEIEISRISSIIDNMMAPPLLTRVDELPETHSRSMMVLLNVHTFACTALYQTKHKIIGCLQIHWLNDPEHRGHDPINKEWLDGRVEETVKAIEFMLIERMSITGTVSGRKK